MIGGRGFVQFFDASRVVSGAEGAAGVVALFLEGGDVAVKAAKEVDHWGEGAEITFDISGVGGFLEEDLREASGGGLKADFGDLGSIIAAEMIDEVVLVEPVLEDEFLNGAPLAITAGGPIGDIALSDSEAGLADGGGDVPVMDAVGDHVIDHVANRLGQASDAAATAGLVLRDRGWQRLGINEGGRMVGLATGRELAALGGSRLKAECGWPVRWVEG